MLDGEYVTTFCNLNQCAVLQPRCPGARGGRSLCLAASAARWRTERAHARARAVAFSRRCAPRRAALARRWWFNTCIKAFVVLFSYINFLPIPWRVSCFHHVYCSRRPNEEGVDFYGRPTDALWFNLSKATRRKISLGLNLAWMCHFAALATHIVWPEYIDGQSWPAVLYHNLPMVRRPSPHQSSLLIHRPSASVLILSPHPRPCLRPSASCNHCPTASPVYGSSPGPTLQPSHHTTQQAAMPWHWAHITLRYSQISSAHVAPT
jgi:hypothetical protein